MRVYVWFGCWQQLLHKLFGQVFEVNGGASSLYQAQGGTLSVRGPSYKASLGAGTVAGRFVGGANFTKVVGRATWITGDDLIHFVLPTDIFDASHYVVAQGAGVLTTLRNTGVFAFAGATSTEFDSPLFEGARAENPAFILFLDRRLAPGLSLSSKMIFSTTDHRHRRAGLGARRQAEDWIFRWGWRQPALWCGEPRFPAEMDHRAGRLYRSRETSSIARWWKRRCSANPTAKTR